MKKLLIVCSLALVGLQHSYAQAFEPHVGVGVGVGTTGIAIDASATINPWLGARFGVDIMPLPTQSVKFDLDVEDKTNNTSIKDMSKYIDDLNKHIDDYNKGVSSGLYEGPALEKVNKDELPDGELPKEIEVEGKLSNTTMHFLVDVYPFGKKSSFHLTAGAYFGPSKIIKVNNKEPGFLKTVNQWNNAIVGAEKNPTSLLYTKVVKPNDLQMIGAELGDYFITPNPADKGDVAASIKVSGFRPYLGLGFGRAVPKGRLGCQFDLGVQFWNSPKIYAPNYDKLTGIYTSETQLEESNAGGDAGGIIKIISKVSVYPVLNLRLVGRLL